MPLLLCLLCCLAALAAPEDTLDSATRKMFEAASSSLDAGDARRAVAGYQLVLTQEPTFAPAVLGLGAAYEALGDPALAEAAYARLPNEADAVEALARLVEQEHPERAAELYRRLQTLRLGEPWPYLYEARARAGSDPLGALEAMQTYLGLLGAVEPDGEALVALAVALENAGHEAEALSLLERYSQEWPEGGAVQEARGRMERWAVEHAARALAIGGDEPLPLAARGRVEEARRRFARGRGEEALAILREIVRLHPRSAEGWGALGDVHQAAGRLDQAEIAFGWAVALAPDEAAWHARLGLLLAEAYGGRRHREAAESLSRALSLRPAWPELQYQLGCVLQGLGEWEEAERALGEAIVAEPRADFAWDARRRLDALTRKTPEPPDRQVAGSCPPKISAETCAGYRVARVYQVRGDLLAARAELDPVLAEAPGWSAALNLLAALELAQGRSAEAVAAWQRSLNADPQQPQVLLYLGELARREGREQEAASLLQRAAQAGAADAWYSLAEIAFAAEQVDLAAAHLDAYFASSSGGLKNEPALALRRELEHRDRQRQLGLGLVGGLVVVAGLGGLIWRQSGSTLRRLVSRAPESVHDLASVLSALRHEVLKHNTTLLGEVASALERGDHQAVAFAADRLFGAPGSGDRGIVARFHGYIESLERLGRRHRVRLDLRRKDPVIAPMFAGMRRLERLEPHLRRPWRGHRGLSAELRSLSDLLNGSCYRALGRFLREMSTLTIDAELLRTVDDRVRAEPAFSGQALPELELDVPVGGLPARILRGDLEDIVANLLRNAYRAVGEGLAPGQRRVGLGMDEDVDVVTGLESVLLRFRDNAPGTLTTAMIRSRNIGRGLGLVVDLATRHDGSVLVEPERGWAKAVVVRLPRAETPGGADLETTTLPGGGAPDRLSWEGRVD